MSDISTQNRSCRGFGGIAGFVIAFGILLVLFTLFFVSSGTHSSESDEDQIIRTDSDTLPAGNPMQAAKKTELKMRLMELKFALQSFQALEGRKPASLKELTDNPDYNLTKLPEGYSYSYDGSTGKAVIVKDGTVVCE